MNKSRHHYFRWTPRTARITFLYVAVIPAICGYVAYNTDVSGPPLTAGEPAARCSDGGLMPPRDSGTCAQSEGATLYTRNRWMAVRAAGCVGFVHMGSMGLSGNQATISLHARRNRP